MSKRRIEGIGGREEEKFGGKQGNALMERWKH